MAPSTRRVHRLTGGLVAVVSLIGFFVWVWPPGALLVSATAGVLYSLSQPTQ